MTLPPLLPPFANFVPFSRFTPNEAVVHALAREFKRITRKSEPACRTAALMLHYAQAAMAAERAARLNLRAWTGGPRAPDRLRRQLEALTRSRPRTDALAKLQPWAAEHLRIALARHPGWRSESTDPDGWLDGLVNKPPPSTVLANAAHEALAEFDNQARGAGRRPDIARRRFILTVANVAAELLGVRPTSATSSRFRNVLAACVNQLDDPALSVGELLNPEWPSPIVRDALRSQSRIQLFIEIDRL